MTVEALADWVKFYMIIAGLAFPVGCRDVSYGVNKVSSLSAQSR